VPNWVIRPWLAALPLVMLALVLQTTVALAQPAAPGASEWSIGEKGQARLISTVARVGDLPVLQLGLEVLLEEGWKTYWRSPGDAGVPPQIDWRGSANIDNAALLYPAPKRFTYYDFDTFGYSDRVVYPIELLPVVPGEEISLQAELDILICDDVCIPHDMTLSLRLPPGPSEPTEFVNIIDRYFSQVPGDGQNSGLALEDAVLRGTKDAPLLQIAFKADEPFVAPDVLVEGPQFVSFDYPKIEFSDDATRVLATLTATDAFGAARDLELTSMPLTVTLLDGQRSMEITIAPQFGAATLFDYRDFGAAGAGSTQSFVAILLLALLGGLILNLMPCVLPVLSIKLLSVVGHGGGDPRQVRIGFLATTAGIISAFLALAGFLITLKSLGMAAGWGIQFQQPAFIITLVLILVLFAANMWGWFEVRLPGAVSDVAVAGSGHSASLTGQFGQGVFATVLATPCSAPFLGTAVGFALSRGPLEILAVFAALGLGMASPFILVALVPRLATALPKPGPWMLVLKKGLALALLATAAWLLSVLSVQVSPTAALSVAALLIVALGALAWKSKMPRRWSQGVPATLLVIAVAAYLMPTLAPTSPDLVETEPYAQATWVPFDQSAIAQHVRDGQVVFVDITADWCITCQVNKRRVLNSDRIAELLETDRVIAMRADWTQPDDVIANYLASFNRFGIPFNVVYGPQAPAGITLPELLSGDAVMAAFERVGVGVPVAAVQD